MERCRRTSRKRLAGPGVYFRAPPVLRLVCGALKYRSAGMKLDGFENVLKTLTEYVSAGVKIDGSGNILKTLVERGA